MSEPMNVEWPVGATIQYGRRKPVVVSDLDDALLINLEQKAHAELARLDRVIAKAQRDRAAAAVRQATLTAERDRRGV